MKRKLIAVLTAVTMLSAAMSSFVFAAQYCCTIFQDYDYQQFEYTYPSYWRKIDERKDSLCFVCNLYVYLLAAKLRQRKYKRAAQ